MSGELIDTTEMYLRTLYELLEEGIDLRRARIVERLHQSGPTVSQTVARMERDGLLVVRPDRTIEFTPAGHAQAVNVMRKHRLAECLLTQVIGLDTALVHGEACRWEHVISDEVENRLIDILDDPDKSPYGNAIPAIGQFTSTDSAVPFRRDSHPLAEFLIDGGEGDQQVRIVRFTEHFQATEPNLATVKRVGLEIGVPITARLQDGAVLITGPDGSAEFSEHDADGIFIVPATIPART
ncbi:Tox regulatory factor [Acidipropionibacterium jensenii]|uniref:Tox regulatory factor n=2 Tax=Acidipropionibacterium jensenii TaxID=1749 RepID=A0A3Q9UPE0_9ACTN|nr:metal-dependent transcriptional regulator [Acidipropionibacterium jensenii]QCV87239.1 metal-dependent transcriptional regulator [Acidipropionibacterium jensenii]VEI01854.1 Tox regulatory factor [Acidipropionibacterium jensenii]